MHQPYPHADLIDLDFESRDQWIGWWNNHPEVHDHGRALEIVKHTQEQGVWEPLTLRYFPGSQIEWNEQALRESGLASGISGRNRAVLYALHTCLDDIDQFRTSVYGTEAITNMARLLRWHFPKFLGSEYSSDPAAVKNWFPIPIEDLTALSFEANSFDVAITTEVLEHVPSLDAALSELARILKPGGWHIGTCPFAVMDEASLVKARIENGRVVHLMEPEYHGDPMGTGGSLVFEIPGWDILARAKKAGFTRAFWKYLRSHTFGIVANQVGGVFVLCLQK